MLFLVTIALMGQKKARAFAGTGKLKQGQADPWAPACPSRELIELLASKWVLLLIPLLRKEPLRNGELMRRVGGISQKMLTQTLRELEQRQLVSRHVRDDVPPHVEYSLTPLGQSLATAIGALDEWVIRNYHRTIER